MQERSIRLKIYSVMIVEDEAVLLNNISNKIRRFSNRLTVCATASNGQDALTLMAVHKPDIVFTDIVMPVADGLSMIRQATELGLQPQFVILSSYSDFEYAKTAMEFGIRHYLLKPVPDHILHETILKIVNELDSQLGTAEQTQLNLLLNSVSNNSTGDAPDMDFYVVLLFSGNYISKLSTSAELESIFTQHWSNMPLLQCAVQAADEMGVRAPMVHHSAFYNERFLVFRASDIGPMELHAYLRRMHELLKSDERSMLLSMAALTYPIPSGGLFATVKDLRAYLYTHHRAWQQEAYTLERGDLSSVLSRRVSALHVQPIIHNLSQHKEKAAANMLLEAMLQWEESGVSVEQFYQNLHFLLLSVCRDKSLPYYEDWRRIEEEVHLQFVVSSSLHSFHHSMVEMLEQLYLPPQETKSTREIVEQVKAYMDENFSKEIGLVEITSHFHLSHAHLSRIFKSVYSQSPINYLITLRIEKACALLREHPALEAREVGQMVGYSDQYYFSKLFKKYKGASPTEYRRLTTGL